MFLSLFARRISLGFGQFVGNRKHMAQRRSRPSDWLDLHKARRFGAVATVGVLAHNARAINEQIGGNRCCTTDLPVDADPSARTEWPVPAGPSVDAAGAIPANDGPDMVELPYLSGPGPGLCRRGERTGDYYAACDESCELRHAYNSPPSPARSSAPAVV
jgi:hypothetical protein